MATDVSARPFAPSACAVAAPAAAPEDLAGVRFLRSVGWAVLVAAWGGWLGSMVESAVAPSAESRIGALIAAAVLAACGAVLAYLCSARHGTSEAVGRALMDGVTLAWQGAWLGGLVGGGVTAANGGAWVVPLAFGTVFVGALAGFGLGARLFAKDLHKILSSAIWGGVIAGFAASFLWAPAAATPVVTDAPWPAFGPGADWIWRGAAAAPLVIAALVWWVRWMREEQSKGGEKAVGWGMGVTAFLFVAAMAVGLGAIVGGLAQLGCGYLVRHVTLAATPGMWLGALTALFFWGLGQQPKRPATAP